MSLETNLKMIKLLLDDMRSGAKFNANDSRALRIIIDNVHQAAMNKKLGSDKDIERCDYAFMSEKFKSDWEKAGKPSCSQPVGKIGILEHVIPLNIIIRRMVDECTDEESIFNFISAHHKLVFVTNEEDMMLNEAGYRRTIPDEGNRYSAVGIEIHPEVVLCRNFKKYKEKSQ